MKNFGELQQENKSLLLVNAKLKNGGKMAGRLTQKTCTEVVMRDDAFKSALEVYENLIEKYPEKIGDILPKIENLITQKNQYDKDIDKTKCEEKTKQDVTISEMLQKYFQLQLQLQMQSLCSPPENKVTPKNSQSREPEVRGESASTKAMH